MLMLPKMVLKEENVFEKQLARLAGNKFAAISSCLTEPCCIVSISPMRRDSGRHDGRRALQNDTKHKFHYSSGPTRHLEDRNTRSGCPSNHSALKVQGPFSRTPQSHRTVHPLRQTSPPLPVDNRTNVLRQESLSTSHLPSHL